MFCPHFFRAVLLYCDLTPLIPVGEAVKKVYIADWLSEAGQATERGTEDCYQSGPDGTEKFLWCQHSNSTDQTVDFGKTWTD